MPKHVLIEIPEGKYCGDCPFVHAESEMGDYCRYVTVVLNDTDSDLEEEFRSDVDLSDFIKHVKCPGLKPEPVTDPNLNVRRLSHLLSIVTPDARVAIGPKPGDGQTALLVLDDPDLHGQVGWIQVPVITKVE